MTDDESNWKQIHFSVFQLFDLMLLLISPFKNLQPELDGTVSAQWI